jgi:nucleolar protein 9
MDMYKRRRGDWVRQSKNKASNDGFQSFSELEDVKNNGTATQYKKKSPLELARERHAKNKAAKESGKDVKKSKGSGRSSGSGGATGSNSTPVGAQKSS